MTTATLRDVAKLAGVSLGTASQALNNRPHVLPETRAKVLGAATTLGYTFRNSKALNGQASVKLSVIGMLTKDTGMPVEVNPFFSHVQYGVESECRAHNISLMYANVEEDDSNHPVQWPRMVTDRHVDGLIVVGANIEELVGGIMRKLDKPIVLIDSYAPHYAFDSVLMNNAGGVEAAVNHLMQQGHRDIGLVGWNPASPPDIHERRDGYVRALRAAGIERTFIEPCRMTRPDGYAAAHRLLGRAPEVTAIVATNDDTAIGVMNAVKDRRLNVPRDISIVGFDDIDLASEIQPALTTVHVYKAWLGRLGVQHLISRAEHPDQPQITTVVATRLIERESVAPPKHANARR
jgi:LacI family transcriptional regulator